MISGMESGGFVLRSLSEQDASERYVDWLSVASTLRFIYPAAATNALS